MSGHKAPLAEALEVLLRFGTLMLRAGDTAYLPALADYTIMVRGHAKMLTIHPQPVRALAPRFALRRSYRSSASFPGPKTVTRAPLPKFVKHRRGGVSAAAGTACAIWEAARRKRLRVRAQVRMSRRAAETCRRLRPPRQ